MNAAAIVMMIVAILTLWGGLAAATVSLFLRPDLTAHDDEVPQDE